MSRKSTHQRLTAEHATCEAEELVQSAKIKKESLIKNIYHKVILPASYLTHQNGNDNQAIKIINCGRKYFLDFFSCGPFGHIHICKNGDQSLRSFLKDVDKNQIQYHFLDHFINTLYFHGFDQIPACFFFFISLFP